MHRIANAFNIEKRSAYQCILNYSNVQVWTDEDF